MKTIFYDNIGFDSETMFYETGTIKSFPAHYAYNQHVLAGTATSVKMRGSMTVEDNGTFTFAPSVPSNHPRYQTIFHTKHGSVRETKEDFIMVIKLPKRLGKKRLCALHYEMAAMLHRFLKTFKW